MRDEKRDKKRCCAYICGPHLEPCILVKAHDEKDCICLKCCAAERDRLKRLVESAREIEVDNYGLYRCADGNWAVVEDDYCGVISTHDTVLEAFEAVGANDTRTP